MIFKVKEILNSLSIEAIQYDIKTIYYMNNIFFNFFSIQFFEINNSNLSKSDQIFFIFLYYIIFSNRKSI